MLSASQASLLVMYFHLRAPVCACTNFKAESCLSSSMYNTHFRCTFPFGCAPERACPLERYVFHDLSFLHAKSNGSLSGALAAGAASRVSALVQGNVPSTICSSKTLNVLMRLGVSFFVFDVSMVWLSGRSSLLTPLPSSRFVAVAPRLGVSVLGFALLRFQRTRNRRFEAPWCNSETIFTAMIMIPLAQAAQEKRVSD